MNFQNKLYTVLSESGGAGGAEFSVLMNPDHVIYGAHFPEDPITPGVCILQIGLELLGRALGRPLELCRVKNVKFLSILRPDGVPVTVSIRKITEEDDRSIPEDDSGGTVSAQLEFSASGAAVAKMSLICRKRPAAGTPVSESSGTAIHAAGVSEPAEDCAAPMR